MPTFWCIATTPHHFFRRLPLILTFRRTIYPTPIKFFTSSSALFIVLFFARHSSIKELISQPEALWYMLALIPITPFAMIILAIVLLFSYQLPRLIPTKTSFPQPDPYPLLLVLSPKTYINLNWLKFFWALFYLSIYFIVMWQFAQIFIGMLINTNNYLLEKFATEREWVEMIILICSVVIAALIIHAFIFRPYSALVRMSLKRPVPNIFKSDVEGVEFLINDFFEIEKKGELTEKDFNDLISGLKIPIENITRAVRQENVDFSDMKMNPSLNVQRAKVYSKMLQLVKLEDVLKSQTSLTSEQHEKFVNVLDQLKEIVAGTV